MKFALKIVIGFCVLLQISKAQNPLFFDKYYSIGYANSYNNNVLRLYDSSYFFSSYVTDSATGRMDYGLFKTDKFGNLLQSNIINYFNLNYLRPSTSYNNIINISNGSLITVATTIINNKWAIVFSKLSSQNADTIKTMLYTDSLHFYSIGNLIQLHSNKIFAIGNIEDQPYTHRNPSIIELDSNLNMLNTTYINNPQNFVTFFANRFSNGKIIIGGFKQISTINYPFIAEIDTLGNILNYAIMNNNVNGITQVFYNAYDNTYFTVGALRTSIYGNQNMYRICVSKFDVALNMLWQKTYAKSNYTTNAYDAVVNNDGSMVLVGRYSDSLTNPQITVNTNAFMLKINSTGDSLWMKEFDNINETGNVFNSYLEVFFGIEKTPEGGYIMCGNAQQQPKAQAWVVKTDSLGCILDNCYNPTNIVNTNIDKFTLNIYPNPSSSVIKVELSDNNASTPLSVIRYYKIKITDIVGKEVLKEKYKEETDISLLENGIYFLSIYKGNTLLGTKKLIKE